MTHLVPLTSCCLYDVLLPIVCIWGIQSHPWLEPAVCCSGNCGVRPCSYGSCDPTMIPRKAIFMLADVAPQGSWAGRSGVWRGTCTFDGGKRGRYHLFKAQCLGRWTICPRPKTTIISTGWNKQHRSVLDELVHIWISLVALYNPFIVICMFTYCFGWCWCDVLWHWCRWNKVRHFLCILFLMSIFCDVSWNQ